MKKTLTFWVEKDWESEFFKPEVWWQIGGIPEVYINKEHIKASYKKDWLVEGDKLFDDFRKVRITIEEEK